VDTIIVDLFILQHYLHMTAATISQVLGLPMMGVIAHPSENAQWAKETVIPTMIVPLDSPVEQTTVDSFIPTLRVITIAATISQGLGLPMMRVIARPLENARWAKETVITTMTVPMDSPVEQTTVNSFIPTLRVITIAVTISQVSGLPMMGVIARPLENVQRDKETVIVTMIVPPDSPVEQTTVESFIPAPNLIMTVVYANSMFSSSKQAG